METEREATEFDAGYYGRLMEKAWREVAFMFKGSAVNRQ